MFLSSEISSTLEIYNLYIEISVKFGGTESGLVPTTLSQKSGYSMTSVFKTLCNEVLRRTFPVPDWDKWSRFMVTSAKLKNLWSYPYKPMIISK